MKEFKNYNELKDYICDVTKNYDRCDYSRNCLECIGYYLSEIKKIEVKFDDGEETND